MDRKFACWPVSTKHMVARCVFFTAYCLLPAACCLLPAAYCSGQEVQWRTDYPSARREAAEKGLPIVIDLSTENCIYCKQLDSTTLREPAIVSLLNERFIPLKLDAQRDANGAKVAERLNIQGFPAIVFASSEGKILGMPMIGYQTVVPLQEQLQQVLTSVGTPDGMARDYQAASQAIAAADYTRAIALLKTLVEDNKDRPIQLKARQLLQELEQQAAGRLARARQLADKGQTTEALDTTTEVLRVFSGTQAAVEARRMLSSLTNITDVPRSTAPRNVQAQELLARAREEFRLQQYLACLNHCETLSAHFADALETAEAAKLANEIKSNPEWMRQACDGLSDQLAVLYLSMAESWVRKGQPQQAALCLERVVQMFAGTRHAEMAQVRLSQIQGQPTRPVEYQKH